MNFQNALGLGTVPGLFISGRTRPLPGWIQGAGWHLGASMSASWTWSLALIALTTAVHSFGIVMLSLIGVRVHAYLKGQRLHFWQAVMILTVVIAAIGLSLAVLHGLEAAVWAGAYLWLGASDTLVQALLFSVELDDDARGFGTGPASALAVHGRAGSRGGHADVWHQHGVCFSGTAALLARPTSRLGTR